MWVMRLEIGDAVESRTADIIDQEFGRQVDARPWIGMLNQFGDLESTPRLQVSCWYSPSISRLPSQQVGSMLVGTDF